MRKILAIAGIAIRNAIRSRVVLVLVGLLLLAIVALPLTIKGDGTLSGTVQVLLRYTLGAVSIILSISSLWAGCAAIATEVEEHQVHLIATKPVHRGQLWLGKWVGLMLLNTVLLTVAGGVTYGLLRWNLSPQRLSGRQQETVRDDILVARRIINPQPAEVEADARKILEEEKRQGQVPPNARPDEVLEAVRQMLVRQMNEVPTGRAVRYIFKLPHASLAGRPLVIRYKFASSLTSKDSIQCLWVAGAPNRPDRFEQVELAAPDGVHSLHIPYSMVAADGTLTLDVANVHPEPMTMVFTPNEGIQLLVSESSFEANLIRSLLIILCELAFLSALAVTLGSLFSLPVAALTAVYCVLLMNIGSYLQSLTTERIFIDSQTPNASPGLLDLALHFLYVILYWLTKPFQTTSPLEPLAGGELVTWFWVGNIFWWQVIVAAGLIALLGTWIFNRRELGLPA